MGQVVARDDAGQDPQALEALLLLFVGELLPLIHASLSSEGGAPPRGGRRGTWRVVLD